MSEKTHSKEQGGETTNIALASRVARDVELQSVLLRQASVVSEFEPREESPEISITQQHRYSYEVASGPRRLLVNIGFSLQLHAKGTEKTTLSVLADYRLDYSLPDDKHHAESELKYFAELNGTLNAWPYWRELVNSVASRVGLGGITVPLFRIKAEKVPVIGATPAGSGSAA